VSELPTVAELMAEMTRLSKKLDNGIAELARLGHEYGTAEHAYRQARAVALLKAEGKTVGAREAHVDITCSDQMLRVRLAEGMRLAAVESVRSRRAQISALQSIARAVRAEMDLAKHGPDDGP
jgi:hypothetical protein